MRDDTTAVADRTDQLAAAPDLAGTRDVLTEDGLAEDVLVEEVSIDGMCGVY